jgi:hypothetical protein
MSSRVIADVSGSVDLEVDRQALLAQAVENLREPRRAPIVRVEPDSAFPL